MFWVVYRDREKPDWPCIRHGPYSSLTEAIAVASHQENACYRETRLVQSDEPPLLTLAPAWPPEPSQRRPSASRAGS